MPKITLLLPVYNSELYLSKAIQSILQQTYTDFELLIINDGSTDNSLKIIQSFNDNRIRIIKNSTNLGLIKTLNKGILLAKGKYIARMDADDIAMPKRLEKQFYFLEKNTNYTFVGSQANLIFNSRVSYYKLNMETNPKVIELSSLFFSPFVHPTIMIRTSIAKDFLYDIEFPVAEDYHLWRELIRHQKKGINLKESLLYYRIHENNISITKQKEQLNSIRKIYQLNLDSISLNYTKQELDVYLKVSDSYKLSLSKIEFTAIKSWLIKMQQHLLNTKQFEEEIIENVFGKVWYRIHRKNSKQGLQVFSYYLFSRNNLHLNISIKNTIFLFIKCLSKKS